MPLTAQGARAHAALPEMGASAIHAMLAWMQLLLESGAEETHGLTINPRQIRGGAGLFMVAQQCEAAIDIHAPPGVEQTVIDELIEHARDKAQATHPRCELQFENLYWANGYANAPDEPLLAPLRQAFQATGLDWSPAAFRSHSDGSLFHQKGSIPVICGPGRLEVAHTRHEHVSLQETLRCRTPVCRTDPRGLRGLTAVFQGQIRSLHECKDRDRLGNFKQPGIAPSSIQSLQP